MSWAIALAKSIAASVVSKILAAIIEHRVLFALQIEKESNGPPSDGFAVSRLATQELRIA